LARARSFIEWDKAHAFAKDLRSLTDTLTSELGAAAPPRRRAGARRGPAAAFHRHP